MVIELAEIVVKEGYEGHFEAGVAEARPLFLSAPGCSGLNLWKSIEKPLQYRLVVEWNTLEDHTVSFRGSPAFVRWRELVQDCFDGPVHVEHQMEVDVLQGK